MVPLRLEQVAGFKERKNDVVYCKPLIDSPLSKVVIFFPGDVQASAFFSLQQNI